MGRRIGIMGGTFDPIHYGHLVTAEAARVEYGLEKVVFVPAGNPPHKTERRIADAGHRYHMVKLACKTNPYFRVSRVEIEREGYSYTLDTVAHFRAKYGKETELFFITGADAIREILDWHRVGDLMRICYFIAATRPGYHFDEAQNLPPEFAARVSSLNVTALAISSSQIRGMVENQKSIKYLLPEVVEEYIRKHALYVGGNDETA